MTKKFQVKCPSCKKAFNYYDSEFRPFCCERCRMVDLGHWLDENYRVPSKSPIDIDELEMALMSGENAETNSEE